MGDFPGNVWPMSSQDFMPSSAYLDVFRSLPALRSYFPFNGQFVSGASQYTWDKARPTTVGTLLGTLPWVSLGTQEDTVYFNLDGSTNLLAGSASPRVNPNLIDGWVGSTIRGMTLGGWIRFDSNSRTEYLMARRDTSTNLCYGFWRDVNDQMTWAISTNGTAWHKIQVTTGGPATISKWHFMVAQVKQTEMRIFIDGTWFTTTSGIPSTIYQTTGVTTNYGARNSGAGYAFHLDGRLAHCFLTASYLPGGLVERLWHITRKGFRL